MNSTSIQLLLGSLALGLLGAAMCTWVLSRSIRTQLAAQLHTRHQMLLYSQIDARQEAGSLRDGPMQSVDLARFDALDRSVEAMQTGQAAMSPVLLDMHAMLMEFGGKANAMGERDGFLRQEMQALRRAQEQAAEYIERAGNTQVEQQARQLQFQAEQFQSLLESRILELRANMFSSVPPQQQSPPSPLPQRTDAALLIEQLQARIAAEFETQRQASERAQQEAGEALQQLLQRVPQTVQQAIQVELEFQTQQQAARDDAHASVQMRWQVEQKEHRVAELQVLLQALAPAAKPSQVVSPEPPVLTQRPVPPLGAAIAPTQAVSAQPPELMHTPLPRPPPEYEPEEPVPELSDEELDALPPELPESGKPRKRILPAPRKPSLRKL